MKKGQLFLALQLLMGASLLSARADSGDPVPTAPSDIAGLYALSWNEPFAGTTLDPDNWDYLIGSRGLGYNQPQNITVSDNAMHILLKQEPTHGKPYSSGGVISKAQFLYGFYEARLRVPSGQGWHTGFWLMSADIREEEIDVIENESSYNTHVVSGVHDWTRDGLQNCWSYFASPASLSDTYHVYGLEFTPTTLKYFLDGAEIKEMSATTFPHGPVNIRFDSVNLNVGGPAVPSSSDFNYVRYFRKK